MICQNFNCQNIRIRKSKRQNENKNNNKNGETLMSSNEDNENENEDDDETMSQNKKIKDLNYILDEIIEKLKSFEEQIKSLKKLEDLKGHFPYHDFGDKELKSKYLK